MKIRVLDFAPAGTFEWPWPEGNVEHFKRSWCGRVVINKKTFKFRHALGQRPVYGNARVHGVTWVAHVHIEGNEADDYGSSRALVSLIRKRNMQHARTRADVPSAYDRFLIVDHRREISAPRSPRSLAVKIAEDDVAAWATHAAIRVFQKRPRKV
jgi:hypothetical protein